MTTELQGTVTRLLQEIDAGTEGAQQSLFRVVYDELRLLAQAQMRKERPDHTLQSTALVHEACLRLLDADLLDKARNRQYLFGAAARAMRQILIDHARKRAADKRGGDRDRVPFDQAIDALEKQHRVDLVVLNDALDRLADLNSRQSELVELRFFGGCSMNEAAEALGISVSTAEQDWRMARAWLHKELSDGGNDS